MPAECNNKWHHFSRLLDQALDLEEPERARWLELLAIGDPPMAEMVSATLAARAHEGFAGFLAGSAIRLEGMVELLLHAKPEILGGKHAAVSRLLGVMASKMAAHHPDEQVVSISPAEISS
jgi:hypothetical protein